MKTYSSALTLDASAFARQLPQKRQISHLKLLRCSEAIVDNTEIGKC